MYLLRFEDIRKTNLIRKDEHLYVTLATPIQLFYTMAQLRKLHRNLAHLSGSYLYEPLKPTGTKIITSKTLKIGIHRVSPQAVQKDKNRT